MSRQHRTLVSTVLWISLLLVGLGGLSAAIVMVLNPAPSGAERPLGLTNEVVGPSYLGADACRDCHPGNHAAYLRSGHARTLRPAADRLLARELDGELFVDPERPGVTWRYVLSDGRFFVERAEGEDRTRVPVDFAFGSGYHATTFLTMTDNSSWRPRALEHRLTYFARTDSMGITPGQEEDAGLGRSGPLGYELPPSTTLDCFGCHVTRTSAEGPFAWDEATMIPNVSCERCHGPGSEHVEAASLGDEDGLTMPFGLGNWTADEMMTACGDCHRHPSDLQPWEVHPDNRKIVRYQPVGLMRSRCFRESDGQLSCVTCHDPHAHDEEPPSHYEAACLTCHGSPAPEPVIGASRRGCIDCHMPSSDSGQGILFADHWIRIRRDLDLDGPCTRDEPVGVSSPHPDPE